MKPLALILLFLSVLSCSPAKVDTQAEAEKLMEISREWARAATAGDMEKTLSFWADDAYMISAGDPPLEGKAAIQQMVEQSFSMPGFKITWDPKKAVVSESGDMAYLIEDSQISYPDSAGNVMTFHNKAVSIWRKQADGSWKNVVDISAPIPSNH